MLSLEGPAAPVTWVQNAKTLLGFTLVYFLIDFALNAFAFVDAWTIIWPLNGINVALLLMKPRSRWPWMLIGIEIGTGVAELFYSNGVWSEIGQRVFSAIEVLISTLLLPPFISLDQWLRTPRIFVRFAAALVLGPGVSGLLAALMFHYAQGETLLTAFNGWATADALGMAATMPLALSWRSPQMRNLFRREALSTTLGLLVIALGGAEVIFSVSRYPLLFLLFPLLLLVDSVLSFAGSAIAVVGVLFISVFYTSNMLGPFGTWRGDVGIPRDLAMQIFFGFELLALFPASLMFMERRRMAAELHDTNTRLTLLAALDGLTGIANRRSFDERFAQEWNRCVRSRKPLALAMIDLDNFKQYNDQYGHVEGDKCLCAVAQALSHLVQRPEDLIARFGGEEFALLLPNTAADGALRVTERIRAGILALGIDHIGNSWKKVTVSIGYSSFTPTQSDGQSALIQLADAALYQAKRNGRNRVEALTSIEGFNAAASNTTARHRIVRMLGRGDR